MIDGKALWLAAMIILAMTAAAIGRLALLPDWHHLPVGGPDDSHTVNGLTLFMEPFGVLLVVGMQIARTWFVSGPDNAVLPWQRFSARILVSSAAVTAVVQALTIARSLGYTQSWGPLTIPRLSCIIVGLLAVTIGNSTPKLPWLSLRMRPFQLDPWQWNRHARFVGRVRVGLGLAVIVGPLLGPPQIFRPIIFALVLAAVTAMIWYRIKLRHEPPAFYC